MTDPTKKNMRRIIVLLIVFLAAGMYQLIVEDSDIFFPWGSFSRDPLSDYSSGWGPSANKLAAGKPASFSSKELNDCLRLPVPASGKCLDLITREFLKSRSPIEALALIRNHEIADQNVHLYCHVIAHSVGREVFRVKKTVHGSFAVCDQTCQSGCYHGVMERFLLGDRQDENVHITPEDLIIKAKEACDPILPARFQFQCLHGLGHAIMFFSGYKLERSLESCDAPEDDWSRQSCYGGVFMENLIAANPAKRDVSPTDYHYPCSKVRDRYKEVCYQTQTSRMTQMGLSVAEQIKECANAGTYRFYCVHSIGRELSNEARAGNPRQAAKQCELAQGRERRFCIKGASRVLADNTWDGKYAFPFCAALADSSDSAFCFNDVAGYLRIVYNNSKSRLMTNCRDYTPGSYFCRNAAELSKIANILLMYFYDS